MLRCSLIKNTALSRATAMTKFANQELLPPESEERDSRGEPGGWLDWLLSPEPARFLLPATGLWILGLDWLLFPKEAATLGLAAPVTSIVGFLAGSMGAYHLQRRYALNTPAAALFKSLLAGLLVGVPFPLAGTLAAAWVLANSGLAGWKSRLWKQQTLRK
jgi:hypothetical protein